MNKGKITAYIIWFITLVGPFNYCFLMEAQPNLLTLIGFIFTILGIAVGALMMSRSLKAPSAH